MSIVTQNIGSSYTYDEGVYIVDNRIKFPMSSAEIVSIDADGVDNEIAIWDNITIVDGKTIPSETVDRSIILSKHASLYAGAEVIVKNEDSDGTETVVSFDSTTLATLGGTADKVETLTLFWDGEAFIVKSLNTEA